MVTAHETLVQLNEESLKAGFGIKNKNPLEMHDETFKMGNHTYVGYHASGKPISQVYKGGRVPRSSNSRLGKMDLLHAIETSSNPYFSLLAGDVLKSPNDLAEAAKKFGFGRKTGIDLPLEISGKIPNDLETNRTGLYATAIGQHSLVVTPLQTAMFLSAFANGGELLKPQVIKFLVGASLNEEGVLDSEEQQSLLALGIDFPLFNMLAKPQEKIQVEKTQKKIQDHVIMDPSLRNLLLEGMRRVVMRTHKESLAPLSRLYTNHPEAISDYVDLKNQIVGKTSTSESMERIDFDEEEGTNLYTHVWFGGISFEKDVNSRFENPEIVVVVYLRYGSFGKETAPLAAQMVKKWREIKARHEK
jgi:cell division protein FtsI/penicillin-binding protein 2